MIGCSVYNGQTKKKKGHGGRRPGAGRPAGTGKPIKAAEDRREQIGVRLPQAIVRWLKRQPEGITATVEKAVARLMEGK